MRVELAGGDDTEEWFANLMQRVFAAAKAVRDNHLTGDGDGRGLDGSRGRCSPLSFCSSAGW
jgi:hypothetical protein